MKRTAWLLASTLLLSGCANQYGSQEQAGMIIGGALGGVLGSEIGGGRGRTAAIIVGTLAGAAVGGAIGRSMDETDRLKTALALENVRTGVTSTWRNPDTAAEYSVTPTRTVETASGPCRDFTMEGLIGGQRETIFGTACREPDGSWTIR
jgi:surface antigen